MARRMTLEQSMKRFYRTHELRQSPGDEQQIECRELPDGDWLPLSFYDTIEEANAKFAELITYQKAAQ